MRLLPLFILLLLALAAHAQQERVAILNTVDDRDSIGISDLAYLTGKLRETAVNVLPKQRYGVMTTESIIAFLGSQENARRVCNESSCLAEVGRKVSADYVAQARMGRFGDQLAINFQLYSVKSGNLIGSFMGNSKDIFGLLAIVEERAPILFRTLLESDSKSEALPPAPAIEYVSPVATPPAPTQFTPNPDPEPVPELATEPIPEPVPEQAIEFKKIYMSGIRAGFNLNNAYVEYYGYLDPSLIYELRPGFAIGFFRNFPISNYLSLVAEFDFSYRELFRGYSSDGISLSPDYDDFSSGTEFAFIVPLMLKLKLGSSFYATAGMQIDIPFMAKWKEYTDGEYRYSDDFKSRSPYDLGIVLGAGHQYKRFAIDLRTVIGLTDIESRDFLDFLGSYNQYGVGAAFLF